MGVAKRKMTEKEFEEFIKQHPEVKISVDDLQKATTIYVDHGGLAKWDHTIPNYPAHRIDRRRGYIASKIEKEYEEAKRDYNGKPKEIIVY